MAAALLQAWMAIMRTICNPPVISHFPRVRSVAGIWPVVLFCLFVLVGQARAVTVNDPDLDLWRAVVAKDIEAAKAALAAGAFVDTPYQGRVGKADDASAWPSVETYSGSTPLIIALSLNDSAMARFLLSRGANPDARANTETSTLFVTVSTGNKALFDELFKRGASLHQRYDGRLLLYDRVVRSNLLRPAVWGGNIEIVKTLRAAGLAWPEDPDEAADLLSVAVVGSSVGTFTGPEMFSYLRQQQVGGQTLSPRLKMALLDIALAEASDAMLEYLVAQLATRDETLLIKALRARRNRLVWQLLEGDRIELSARILEQALGTQVSMSPELALWLLERGHLTLVAPYLADSINLAIHRGQRETFRALASAAYDGRPPPEAAGKWLVTAVENGQSDLVTELLSTPGIELNLDGKPVLAHALLKGDKSLVSALLERGARADLVDRYFAMYGDAVSTLHWLCRQKQPAEWVRPLVASGARLDVRDRAGRLAVHCAAASGQLPLLQALADAGAGIDEEVASRTGLWRRRGDGGKTALMLAIEAGHNDVVAWLLKRGVRTRMGRLTALGTAIAAGNTGAVGILLAHGADPSVEHFSAGMLEPASALALAVEAKQPAVLAFLLGKGVRPAEPDTFICFVLQFPGLLAEVRSELVRVSLAHGLSLPASCNMLPVLAFADSMGLARLLLEHGANIEARVMKGGVAGYTPLMLAIVNEDINTVRNLIALGARVGIEGIVQETDLSQAEPNVIPEVATPLQMAVGSKQIELVQLLLAAGAPVEQRGPGGYTALMTAAKTGGLEVTKLLLAAGADPEAQSNSGKTAAAFAAAAGHHAILALLIEQGSATALGASLQLAAQRGQPESVDTLLADSRLPPEALPAALLAVVEAGSSRMVNRFFSIGKAQAEAREQIVAALLQAGADPDTAGLGNTPLLQLPRTGFPPEIESRLARQLIDGGADPNARATRGGPTPLIMSAQEGRCRLVRTLLELGARPELRGPRGYTALLAAAVSHWAEPDCLQALLAGGADPNATDTRGATALALLSRRRAADPHSVALAELLLAAGARIDSRDSGGYTPLVLAVSANARALAETLLKHGADACAIVRGRPLSSFAKDKRLRARLESIPCP